MVSFDNKKISAALQDFYNATGIDTDLLKADFSPADRYRPHNNHYCSMIQGCPAGKKACRASDISLLEECKRTGTLCMRSCHAGLIDAAIPIHYNHGIIGYIIFGRMKPDTDFSALKSYLSRLGIDTKAASEAFHDIPFYDEEKIRSVSNIATLLVKYILLENLLVPSADDTLEKAVTYIRKNLDTELSIERICRDTNLSKSVLYKAFHNQYHCTVGAFINSTRVERSKALLRGTKLSIEEISQQVGFSSGSYYSKAFKKETGLSPLQFRKSQRST